MVKRPPDDDPQGGKHSSATSAPSARLRKQSGPPDSPGTDLDRLEALRGRLEAVLADSGTSARDLAAVSREYRQTLVQLAELGPAAAGSALDEIAERRAQRGAS